MKKLVTAFGVLVLTCSQPLRPSLDSNLPEPDVLGETVVPQEVVVPPGAHPGAMAFTGTEITVWMVVAAALLLLGVGFLLAARRRARGARP